MEAESLWIILITIDEGVDDQGTGKRFVYGTKQQADEVAQEFASTYLEGLVKTKQNHWEIPNTRTEVDLVAVAEYCQVVYMASQERNVLHRLVIENGQELNLCSTQPGK